MKYVIALIMVVACSACSTVSGLGKDISSASDWTKDKISGNHVDINK